ncbi:Uncharacterized protein OBRU01_02521 [Operophtera brumata]|uniref:SEFIR domain-containing protein n=1 Tax=Operophtera brumata TaxID=104452 RepID=A0A0L7LPR7_OPEBR|nr:Uncharacterized protein OBRU01_02521 [Operophtera brumata]
MEVYPANSQACTSMPFGPLMPNTKIGGVTLKPYIVSIVHDGMRFRFQDKTTDLRNHCRHINISNNAPIDDRSVLYYDCYWPKTDDKEGQNHILDFEAEDENRVVNRGQYYFNVPTAEMLSKFAAAPSIDDYSKVVAVTMNICIASVTALIVATLFAYYIALRVIRRYWCKDYKLAANEIPQPTKVLVIYSPANRLHAECVASFVTYLRTEYGFDVMYDGDISSTSHGDPYIWAEEAFRLASHVMFLVGPSEVNNHFSIYDKPIITAHKNVDVLLLSFIKASRVSRSPKEVLNVFFEHSTGQVPIETRHDKVFFLLKDWQKLISFLSKNLLPKRQIMRTEKGRCFLEDLTRAKKMLSVNSDDVIVKIFYLRALGIGPSLVQY